VAYEPGREGGREGRIAAGEFEMADLFTKQASTYALGRAIYSKSLFSYLASLTPNHAVAWDVGTGNGQAAVQVQLLTITFSHKFLI
jgi:hypothetical protein